MNKGFARRAIVVLAAAVVAAGAIAADERVSAKEAEAMVKKGVAAIKANRDKAIADITNDKDAWVDRELYLVVYGMDGTTLAHPTSPKMVGKNMLDLRDADGKEHIRERMQLAKAKPAFWQDYRTLNRENKKIEPKSMYCERAIDVIVCGGIYKPA
jgi:cytochrome c